MVLDRLGAAGIPHVPGIPHADAQDCARGAPGGWLLISRVPAVRSHACLACCSRVAILNSPFLFTSFGCGLNFGYALRNEWLSFNIRPKKTSPTRRPPTGPRWIGVSFFLNCCCASAST